nr:MAG TPA: hypothetical protein [Caudoviricetes sp.]
MNLGHFKFPCIVLYMVTLLHLKKHCIRRY